MYDEQILECIEDKFKTCKEISNETEISVTRVSIRIMSLFKSGLLIEMQGQSESRGVKPKKYRKK